MNAPFVFTSFFFKVAWVDSPRRTVTVPRRNPSGARAAGQPTVQASVSEKPQSDASANSSDRGPPSSSEGGSSDSEGSGSEGSSSSGGPGAGVSSSGGGKEAGASEVASHAAARHRAAERAAAYEARKGGASHAAVGEDVQQAFARSFRRATRGSRGVVSWRLSQIGGHGGPDGRGGGESEGPAGGPAEGPAEAARRRVLELRASRAQERARPLGGDAFFGSQLHASWVRPDAKARLAGGVDGAVHGKLGPSRVPGIPDMGLGPGRESVEIPRKVRGLSNGRVG